MAYFRRKATPPALKDYRKYKPLLRTDFLRCCAYCEMSEAYRNGQDAFGVDHFRPRKLFPDLDCHYPNLYYCCNECNRYKGFAWPAKLTAKNGFGFADPCECDPYSTHFKEEGDGRLTALTHVGEYSLENLCLNREACLRFRHRRARTRQRLIEYTKALDSIDAPSEIRKLLRQILDDIEAEWMECYSVGGRILVSQQGGA